MKSIAIGALINDQRYAALCEITTHPTPGMVSGHYSGACRPVLGVIVQEVGIFVCVDELTTRSPWQQSQFLLLNNSREIGEEIKETSIQLLQTLGSLTVLNYQEDLLDALRYDSQEL